MNALAVEKYHQFSDSGFSAGMVIKGPWEKSDMIYKFLKNDIVTKGINVIAPAQIHGSDIAIIGNKWGTGEIVADGIISQKPDYCLTVRTADCLPLLLAEPESGVFGAVHIGWRGLIGGIMEKLYLILKNLDIKFNRLYNCLGPAIGACCYEVGAEVAILFDDGFVTTENGRYYLDIRGAARERLLNYGIVGSQLLDIAECTSCQKDKYYSFRRDGQARIQMVSYIYKS